LTEHKRINEEQVEQRSLGTTLAAAAVTGLTAGTANATAQHVIGKLTGDKKDEPKKKG
jgi:hypothetical protein